MYDKGVEKRSHAPGQRWRIEVEYKKKYAQRITEELCQSPTDRSLFSRLVRSSWERSGYSWPTSEDDAAPPRLACEPAPPSSAETLMLWLSTSVAPTMPRVLSSYSFRETIEAMGLQEELRRYVRWAGRHEA